jgi:hypothetical protein
LDGSGLGVAFEIEKVLREEFGYKSFDFTDAGALGEKGLRRGFDYKRFGIFFLLVETC